MVFIGTGIILTLMAGFLLTSRYLLYADTPQKSDIIVLLPDPELEAMRMKVRQLAGSVYSKYLCIPTSFSLYRIDQDGMSFTAVQNPIVAPGIGIHRQQFEDNIRMDYFLTIKEESGFPKYFENTHVEICLAKKIMDAYGFKSAIFVSSPYHMRRIKIITEKVYGSGYDIKMVPSGFMKKNITSLSALYDIQKTCSEIIKTIWFFCYAHVDR